MAKSEKREASPEASPLKGPAPVALPEDTSDVVFEDGIPLSPMAGDQTVQFISSTPANGDAKVEIGDGGVTPSFVGLGKEELMKYANDPFWVRLRWMLFILFWLLWIAMLVGAIVIIVLAPRCAEKKTAAETIYQMRAADLVKDGKLEEHAAYLKNLGVETVVISDALQHEPNDPDAITNYEKLDDSVESGLFEQALEQIKEKGIKILLQIVPNHSGTKHEWFNDNTDFYVRQPYETVRRSVWVTQDKKNSSWTQDPRNTDKAYLQQFSGNVADLDFRNDDVVSAFKQILSNWRKKNVDGFVISKASFLVENLEQLMNSSATRNQPENVKIISRMVGATATGPNLVELENPSDETIKQYIERGLTPVIKAVDTSSPEKLRQAIQELYENQKAVIDLTVPQGREKARLVSLLVSASGSHTLLNHESAGGDNEFLQKLVKFQHDNPRGKSAQLIVHSEGSLISALRTDGDVEHIIVANLGEAPATLHLSEVFNKTSDAKGAVVLATPGDQPKAGDPFEGHLNLPRLSGAVIKLEMKKEEPEST